MIRSGQIALLRFPQSDRSAGKLRPVLVLRRAPGPYEDWLVCMISSQIRQAIGGVDEIIDTSDDDFQASGLRVPSVVRVSRVAVVDGETLAGAIGSVGAERLGRIRSRLASWIAGDA